MRLAIDMDDVMCGFVEGVCDTVSREFDTLVDPASVISWEFSKFLDNVIGYSWWEWLEQHAWLWGEKFKPVPGAIGGVDTLRRAGHTLELLTSKPDWAEDQVFVWLARYKPRFHKVTIVPVEGLGKGRSKVHYTDAELLVDDKTENCLEFVQAGRDALLFAMPHNATAQMPGGPGVFLTRVNGWHEVVEEIAKREANR